MFTSGTANWTSFSALILSLLLQSKVLVVALVKGPEVVESSFTRDHIEDNVLLPAEMLDITALSVLNLKSSTSILFALHN